MYNEYLFIENIPLHKTKNVWVQKKIFNNKEESDKFLEEENIWSYKYKYKDAEGAIIQRFRCNKVKFRGEQCAAGMRLIFIPNSTQIELQMLEAAHTHENISTKRKQIFTKELKNKVDEIFYNNYNIKPKRILEILSSQNDVVPSLTQLNNYLKILRQKKFGNNNISLGELELLLQTHTDIPEQTEKAYVAAYETNYDDSNIYFRFFITSKTLLKNAKYTYHLHADGTYKLNWQGYPVIVVGTTDRDRHFHCFGISVCSAETEDDYKFTFNSIKNTILKIFDFVYCPNVLIADAAPSISNAFKEVFGGNTLIIMCWFHVKKI